MAKTKEERAVLITTAHRGVFFGYTSDDDNEETMLLRRARLCVRWAADLRGFLGLASHGPGQGCKIGHAAPELRLYKITSVSPVTDAATKRWEDPPSW